MRCVVKDKSAPKTGGVTNRACPTVTSRFELHISNFGLVSDFDIRISPDPSGRIMRNKPNLSPANSRFLQNKPNHHPFQANHAGRRSVWSLSRRAGDVHRETQSPCTGTACRAPKTQNKPNSSTPGVQPLRPHPKKCKTNPIRVPTLAEGQSRLVGEPNFRRAGQN